MKHKKIWIAVVIVFLVFFAFGFYTFDSFLHKGINRGLVGMTQEDKYPDWDRWNQNEKVLNLKCDIVSKKGLHISEIYLIERANHYQIRFRIAARMPFCRPNLMSDTYWTLTDFSGNSYTKNMVVYSEQIAGWNCINVTFVLDEEEFVALSGKELNLIAICSEGGQEADIENSYAHCEIKIRYPSPAYETQQNSCFFLAKK